MSEALRRWVVWRPSGVRFCFRTLRLRPSISILSLLGMSAFPFALPGDTVAELQERIAKKRSAYDERLADYNRAVELMISYRGEVEAAELALALRKEEVQAAFEKVRNLSGQGFSGDQEKKAYASAQAAQERSQSTLNEKRLALATAKGDATTLYVALHGYRDELMNLHRQLANVRFRSLQEELSQKKTVVVREEMGCENLTVQACRDGALERAKRSAVEQGSAVLLESETVMEEMQVLLGSRTLMEDRQVTRDWIASQVQGLLVGYDVIARGWVGESGYFYEIEAVVMGQLSRDYFDLVGDEDLPTLPDSEHDADARPTMNLDQAGQRGVGTVFRDCAECPELVV